MSHLSTTHSRTTREGIHRWILRRWNACSIAVTSVTALLLSLGAGRFPGVRCRTGFHPGVLAVCVVFLRSALFARRDTMGMLAFQARLLGSKQNNRA